MLERYQRQLNQGNEKFYESLRNTHISIEECSGLCVLASFCVFRSDLIDSEEAAGILTSDKTPVSKFIKDLRLEDKFIQIRLTHRTASIFRALINDPRIAGIMVIVPLMYEYEMEIGGPERKIFDAEKDEVHALGVLGRLREVYPRAYRRLRVLAKEYPKRGLKEKRKRMVVVWDEYKENPVAIEDSRRILRQMARIPGRNAVVAMAKGSRFDWVEKKIVHEEKKE